MKRRISSSLGFPNKKPRWMTPLHAVAGGAYSGYMVARKIKSLLRTKTKRRRKQFGGFNTGYHIVSRRAKNRVKRKRVKRSKKATVKSLMNMHNFVFSHNLNLCNEIENSRGRILVPSNIAGSLAYCPLVMFSIDQMTNNTPGSGTNLITAYGSNLMNDGGNYYFSRGIFVKVDPDGENGITNHAYQHSSVAVVPNQHISSVWTQNPISYNMASMEKVFQRSIEMDLLMYGQNDQDTMFRVDLVSFNPLIAEELCRMNLNDSSTVGPSTTGSVLSSETSKVWNAMFHSLIAPYTQNPLYKPEKQKGIRFIKSYTFRMPEKSGDYASQPCVKTKIRIPINRMLDKYWKKGTPGHDPEDVAIINNNTDDSYNVDNADKYNSTCPYGERLYVLVRATNTDRTLRLGLLEDVQPGEDPTFDLRMKVKYIGPRSRL